MATLSSKVTPSGVATAAQGALADSAVQPNDSPTFAGLTVDTNTLFVDSANNRVGIGASSPTDALNISSGANQIGLDTGDQATYGTLDLGHFVNGAFIGTQAGSYAGSDVLRFGTSGAERMRIDSSGNVGIGTSSPTHPLSVNGDGAVSRITGSGGDYHGMQIQCADASGSVTKHAFIDALNESGAAVANQVGVVLPDGGSLWAWSTQPAGTRTDRRVERMRIDGSGNVGIGAPATGGARLDVMDGTQRYMFRDGRIDCVNTANTAWGTFATQSNQVDLRTSNGTTRFQMLSNGRIYLPNASASRGFTGYIITTPNDSVANAVRANGYIEWSTDIGAIGTSYFVSDERKKENIAPATKQSSEVIEAIQFIEFDWKPDSGGEGHVEVGVSAQQLQTIDPRLVSTLSDDTLMVNEPALVSHLAKALQEALTKIEALEARLIALEADAP